MMESPPHAVQLRLGLVLAISAGIHILLLTTVASIVVFPPLRTPPPLVAVALKEPELIPIPRVQDVLEGALDRSLSSVEFSRIDALPPMSIPSFVALPSARSPQWTPTELGRGSISPTAFPEINQACLALGQPDIGYRGAFEGTVYFFKKLNRIRSDGKWLQGRGKIKAEDRLYTYVCQFPGRTDSIRPGMDQRIVVVDYRASIPWPTTLAGEYQFRLTSDGGAVFQIDDHDVIDDDGDHPFRPREGSMMLTPGTHRLRLVYMQRPDSKLGLLLHYRRVDQPGWVIFDARTILLAATTPSPHPAQAHANPEKGLP